MPLSSLDPPLQAGWRHYRLRLVCCFRRTQSIMRPYCPPRSMWQERRRCGYSPNLKTGLSLKAWHKAWPVTCICVSLNVDVPQGSVRYGPFSFCRLLQSSWRHHKRPRRPEKLSFIEVTVRQRRLRLFGHVARFPDSIPYTNVALRLWWTSETKCLAEECGAIAKTRPWRTMHLLALSFPITVHCIYLIPQIYVNITLKKSKINV